MNSAYRKTPLIEQEVGQFSNLNNFLFGLLITWCKIGLNRGQVVDSKFVLISAISWTNTYIFSFENGPTPVTKSGVFRYIYFIKNHILIERGKLILGYSEIEFCQLGGYDLVHPDDLKYYANAHKECKYMRYVVMK